jgi:hypothetical protein
MRWCLFIALLASTGCGTTAKFIYPDNVQQLVRFSERTPGKLTAAVTPFEDERGNHNVESKILLYLIPLMPYGETYLERPDAARVFHSVTEFHFNASEDLAKAAATSLRRSGLFKEAYFSYGGDLDKADVIFRGAVKSTTYKGKVFSYGLSVWGPALWVIGLPSGVSTNYLSFTLAAYRRAERTPFWEYAFDQTRRQVHGLYYYLGHDVRGYASLMETAMNAALTDFVQQLPALEASPTP